MLKSFHKIFNRMQSRNAMTLMEILIVTSLIGMVSLALYQALSNGLKVWERSRRLMIEEDVAIFFEKLTTDLRNTYYFADFSFNGGEEKISFPTIVYTKSDSRRASPTGGYEYQMGKVEYYYDILDKTIKRQQANYSQASDEKWGTPQIVIPQVEDIQFRYLYLTDNDIVYSEEALETLPMTVEVNLEFFDGFANRSIKKFVDLPLGG